MVSATRLIRRGQVYKILTLNNISVLGLERLPRDRYEIASEIQNPDAILLRSYKMHGMDILASVKAVGRAGVGVFFFLVVVLCWFGFLVFFVLGVFVFVVLVLVFVGLLLVV